MHAIDSPLLASRSHEIGSQSGSHGVPVRAASPHSWPFEGSPFHEGEQAIQTRLGVRDEIEPWARQVVRNELPEEHRAFYEQLPFVVAGARDADDRPWATLLVGRPGFAHSPDPHTLRVDARPVPGDAAAEAFRAGGDVGLLGIEPHTRRRNRLNGRVARADGAGFELTVGQAFGNCPQYITERRASFASPQGEAARPIVSHELTPRVQRFIEAADTFYIATGHRGQGESAAFGMDVSHRGGEPGFVRADGVRALRFPDYAGNNHFNTLGNLAVDPRAGLLFVDFESGNLLQLTGRVEIQWDPDAAAREDFPGALRVVRFVLLQAVELPGALPLRWDTGEDEVRALQVVSVARESADVTSFLLEPSPGETLAPFRAGQYLPVEVHTGGASAPLRRTYSLSGDPAAAGYRITVKRESHGAVSRHLHDEVAVGERLRVRSPQGEFTLAPGSGRPVVLLGAGVGITPLVSMLHEWVAAERAQPLWLVQGARDASHRPLGREIESLVDRRANAQAHVAYSQPRPGEVVDVNADGRASASEGRIDGALLGRILPTFDADFYLCGPSGWMASIHEALTRSGVPADRIRAESFGPASLATAGGAA